MPRVLLGVAKPVDFASGDSGEGKLFLPPRPLPQDKDVSGGGVARQAPCHESGAEKVEEDEKVSQDGLGPSPAATTYPCAEGEPTAEEAAYQSSVEDHLTGFADWDPFADPSAAPEALAAVEKFRQEKKPDAGLAWPFPESDWDSEPESEEQLPHAWADPAMEAMVSGGIGILTQEGALGAGGPQEEAEKEEEPAAPPPRPNPAPVREEPALVIDDADLGPRTHRLRRAIRGSTLDPYEVFSSVALDGDLKDLAYQACVMSQKSFFKGGVFDTANGRRLALLVDTARCLTLGYCLYMVAMGECASFVIEELAVMEAHRRKGFGTILLRWAADAARIAGCRVVKLACSEYLEAFLEPSGFVRDATQLSDEHFQHWEFWLPDAGLQPELSRKISPAGKQEPHQSKVRLVCFLASHVSEEERLERFAETLQSIALQEPSGPPELFMSWSASTPHLRDRTRDLLKAFSAAIPKLHAVETQGRLSQFQHHAACLRKAGTGLRADGWVFFADDDDLWHPYRYFEFLREIEDVHDTNVKSISAFGHAAMRCRIEPRATCPKDVDKLLMQGPSVCLRTNAEKEARDIPEYFDVAVRNEQFKNFLLRSPQKILGQKFCDRRFMLQYSLHGWGVHWFQPATWLYYYSRADFVTRAEEGSYRGGASFATEVTANEYQIIAQHEAKMPRRTGSIAHSHPVVELDKDGLAFLAASFRASIEEQVIVLEGLERGWVKKEHLKIVCAVAVETRGSISHTSEGVQAQLWNWGNAVAWDLAKGVVSGLDAIVVD